MKRTLLMLLIMTSFLSCKPTKELPTVKVVELNKYAGLWYEIARLPNKFEKGLECCSAQYTLKENGKIEVINKGHKIEDHTKVSEAKGKAWLPNSDFQGRLKVSFFWPFAGDYYIISLDENYQYVLVGSPSRKYLWVLSRTKELDESIYTKLLNEAKIYGFDTSAVIRIKQDC